MKRMLYILIIYYTISFCCSSSPLVEEFTSRFPRMSLHNVLSEFSLPAPLSEHNNPLGLPQQQVFLSWYKPCPVYCSPPPG